MVAVVPKLRSILVLISLCVFMAAHASATPVFFANATCRGSCTMLDFGGPVMTGTTDIYDIWYGDWSSQLSTQTTMDGFFRDVSGSDYMNIASLYNASTTIQPVGDITITSANSSSQGWLGTNLTDAELGTVVNDAISQDGLSSDLNAIYFIFTAPGITETEDNVACGFHSSIDSLKYAWIGSKNSDNGRCGKGTFAQNINMVSSHEMFEAITDPLIEESAPG